MRVPGANAYQMTNVITPAGTTITVSAGAASNQNLVTLNPPFQFAYGSPEKRVYLVGALSVTATAPTWLQYSWGASVNPVGIGTFGEFPAPASRVHQREVY
jgi:hypothetical protein